MKKLLALFLMLTLVFSLTACGSGSTEPEAPADGGEEGEKKIKVGAIFNNTYEEFSIKLKAGIEKACAENGYELIEADHNGDNSKGVNDVENMINMKVDCLILWIFSDELYKDVIERAREAGILVLAVDSAIESTEIDGFVTNDHYQVGYDQAEMLAEGIGGEGEVIVITSPPGTCMTERQEGALDCFAKYPGITVFEVYDEGDKGREGYTTTCENAMLAHPDAKALWAVCADNGLGAVAAANSHGDSFKDILICAGDCSNECAAAIKEGTMYCGYSLMPTNLAYQAVGLIERGLNGEKLGQVEFEGAMYTQENIDEFTD